MCLIPFLLGNIQLVDAFLEDLDAIHQGDATKGQEEPQETELEIEENEGCVPKKYYEYLQSLNDRQREAACSDVTIPLMIVAGPGSGKVCTNILSLRIAYITSVFCFNVLIFSIMDICC